jgi:cytochrome c oxidase assembly factor CtaG
MSVIGHDSVLMHMVQHVLLGAVVPPLFWLVAPVLSFAFGVPGWARRTLAPLGRLVTCPITGWLASTLTVIGWHVPAAFNLAQRSAWWHGIESGSFVVTGLLFWWPVVQPWPAVARLPRPMIPVYLFAATLPCDALSAFLVFCDRVVYGQHLAAHGPAGMSALADQQTAGAFMWAAVTFLYLVPALLMTVQTLSPAHQTST